MKKFELVFFGGASVHVYKIPRHRRYHATVEEARTTAAAVIEKMNAEGLPAAAHPALIFGPGCGADGIRA